MAHKSGTFTATGFGDEVKISGLFTVDLKGFGVASVQLLRKFPTESTFRTVDVPFTDNSEFNGEEAIPGTVYKLECTAYTSGTISWFLGGQGS